MSLLDQDFTKVLHDILYPNGAFGGETIVD